VQEQGYYELKAEFWQEFDPLFARFYSNDLVDAQVGEFVVKCLCSNSLIFLNDRMFVPGKDVMLISSVISRNVLAKLRKISFEDLVLISNHC